MEYHLSEVETSSSAQLFYSFTIALLVKSRYSPIFFSKAARLQVPLRLRPGRPLRLRERHLQAPRHTQGELPPLGGRGGERSAGEGGHVRRKAGMTFISFDLDFSQNVFFERYLAPWENAWTKLKAAGEELLVSRCDLF